MPQQPRRPSPFVERFFLAAIPLAAAGAAVASLGDESSALYGVGVLAVTALLALVAAALTRRLRDTVVYGFVLALGLLAAGVVFFEVVLRLAA